MKKLSTNEKEELRAHISAFSSSGCDAHKSANSSSVRLCVVCVGDTVCCLNV